MKKVYLILRDGRTEFAFSSRAKAEKQLSIILDDIENGNYMMDRCKWTYRLVVDFFNGYGICYEVTNEDTGSVTRYRIDEFDVNMGYKM